MKGQRCDLVLAFYPHARGFAYVAFEGPFFPVDWGMSDLPVDQRTQECLRRLESLLDRYRPDALVLRREFDSGRSAKRFEALTELADKRGIPTSAISRKEIRQSFAHLGSPSRYSIAVAIAKQVSAFDPLMPPVRKIWNGEDRRMGLFDAAALALAYYRSLETA